MHWEQFLYSAIGGSVGAGVVVGALRKSLTGLATKAISAGLADLQKYIAERFNQNDKLTQQAATPPAKTP
jgi:hypothetical protein